MALSAAQIVVVVVLTALVSAGTARWTAPVHAQTGDAVALYAPETLRANGAALRWTRFTGPSGAAFDKYEVHRSEASSFSPGAETLLTTIRDIDVTSYADTTAAPNRAFTYRVVANSSASNARTVTLPAAGTAVKEMQPGPATGKASYLLKSSTGSVSCANHGASATMFLGGGAELTRPVLQFDVHDIPAKAKITSATLSVYRQDQPPATTTIDVHRLRNGWEEGTSTSSCSGSGTTWDETEGGVTWEQKGGDMVSTAAASLTREAGAAAGWDSFDVAGQVQQWVDGDAPNSGLVLKVRDEAAAGTLHYISDDHTNAPDQRPKLKITYDDVAKSEGPDVGWESPPEGEIVSGSTVKLAVDAGDDRRVEKVDFLVDGNLVATDTTAPYELSWDSKTVSNALHTLKATATDDVGNVGSASLKVDVANTAAPTTAVMSPSSRYADTVKALSPVAYWRLGESSGTTAVDASGNGLNGTYSQAYSLGQAGLLTGDANTAVAFRNSTYDGRMLAGVGARLDSLVTAEAWVSHSGVSSSSDTNRVVSRGWGSAGGWLLGLTQGSDGQQHAFFSVNLGGTEYRATTPVPTGKLHLVGRYSGSGVSIFVDGAYKAGVTAPSGTLNTTNSVVIGNSLATDVTVDEVALYDKSVASSDVSIHHQVGSGQTPTISGNSYDAYANAGDDRSVREVEFYVDGNYIGNDTTAPYSEPLETNVAGEELWNGDHTLTTKAYDAENQEAQSTSETFKVDNASGPAYAATLTAATAVPREVTWDPAAPTQDQVGFDVEVKNTSSTTWSATDVVLKPRWIAPNGTFTEQPEVSLGSDLAAGQSATRTVKVSPPALADGTSRAHYTLRVDAYKKSDGKFFAGEGNRPLDKPVNVKKATGDLGLERWFHYDGEELGAGMQQLVNLATGNSLVRFTPLTSTGRGLSTVLDITYNGLEDRSESPLGDNWSLSISSLTRFGTPLDVHPNKADEIAGNAKRYIDLTDGDGTVHRFTGKQASDGTVYWEEPAGVHLYLRSHSDTDPARKWAITRPDRVTYFFDTDGYPTSVEDRHGNRLTYTLEAVPPGEDPGGQKKRITSVSDAGGRAYTIAYYSKAQAPTPRVRGRIKSIKDHSGSEATFRYYDDGNLLRIGQTGGVRAHGTELPSRAWYFTYTTSSGDGPAIPAAADRVHPDPHTPNQSSRLFSVRDPRKNETTFTYLGPGNGTERWKLASRTDRAAKTTSFAYDTSARTTTVTAPLGRVWKYVFDAAGQATKITNPLSEDTTVGWTADRHVESVTTPTDTGTATQRFAYNQNGLLTDAINEEGEHTQLRYEDFAVDGNDAPGKWKTGRDYGHASILRFKTNPKGMATATPASDFQSTFEWDADKRSLIKVYDSEVGPDHGTLITPNADGTVASVTDPNGNLTTYDSYDPSGQPTRVTERISATETRVTQFGYDADGYLRWIQDPEHATDTGPDERSYRHYFDYDSWHRLGRQSRPKSTTRDRGNLIWSAVIHGAGDVIRKSFGPHYGRQWFKGGAVTSFQYDNMDRVERVYGPDKTVDPNGERWRFSYDDAGRLIQATDPRGLFTLENDRDGATYFDYDRLDRPTRQWREELEGATTTVKNTLYTHYCYDTAGDLIATVPPAANTATVDCELPDALPRATRFWHDLAHRPVKQQLPGKQPTSLTYDDNGNLETATDQNGSKTQRFYDQRDLLVKVVEPFDGGTTPRSLTTRLQYDVGGRLIRSVSPRAFDHLGDKASYPETDHYVTSYSYDGVDRLTRVRLPVGPGISTPHYIHRRYDGNDNLTSVSQPTQSETSAPEERRTDVTYWDTGWIQEIDRPKRRKILYDHTAEGWQAAMTPKLPNGEDDTARERLWSYFKDGMLSEERNGIDQQLAYFTYDANNNLTLAHDSRGLAKETQQKPLEVTVDYDTIDRATVVRQSDPEAGLDGRWTETQFGYDLNGNLAERIDNRIESRDGTQVHEPGRRHTFAYDAADWLQNQKDYSSPTAADPQRVIETDYTPTGWQSLRRVTKDGTERQVTSWEYFLNGLQRSMITKAGSPLALRETHTLSYYEDGDARFYNNGHRTRDEWLRDSPKTSVPCQTGATTKCVTSYTYDARDRLLREVRDRGGNKQTTEFELTASGSVAWEHHVEQKLKLHSTYTGDQLATREAYVDSGSGFVKSDDPNAHFRYFHDPVSGDLDCIVQLSGGDRDAHCNQPTGTSVAAELVSDYSYDEDSKLLASREWKPGHANGADPESEATYVYDALNRPVEEREHHPAKGWTTARLTRFSYLGTSEKVSQEQQYKIDRLDSAFDASRLDETKQYSYDPFGWRVSLTDITPAKDGQAEKQRNLLYGYDPQTNVSLLLDESGDTRASYGYTVYGKHDTEETAELKPDAAGPTDDSAQFTDELTPLNPYRYTDKRLFTGNGDLDMGARRFGPDVGQFLQEDYLKDSLADLGLSIDPLTQNRYALAGGNPISFVEDDGHEPISSFNRNGQQRLVDRDGDCFRDCQERSSQSSAPSGPDSYYDSDPTNEPVVSPAGRRIKPSNLAAGRLRDPDPDSGFANAFRALVCDPTGNALEMVECGLGLVPITKLLKGGKALIGAGRGADEAAKAGGGAASSRSIALGQDLGGAGGGKALADATGASWYKNWARDGITRRTVTNRFGRAFHQAVDRAEHIRFSLDGIDDVGAAVSAGRRGFAPGNFTNAELHHIANNPAALAKTTFYRGGQPVRSPFG